MEAVYDPVKQEFIVVFYRGSPCEVGYKRFKLESGTFTRPPSVGGTVTGLGLRNISNHSPVSYGVPLPSSANCLDGVGVKRDAFGNLPSDRRLTVYQGNTAGTSGAESWKRWKVIPIGVSAPLPL